MNTNILIINPLTGRKISLNSKIYKLLTNNTVFRNENNILIPLNKTLYYFDEKKQVWLHNKFKKQSKSTKKNKSTKSESNKEKIFLLKNKTIEPYVEEDEQTGVKFTRFTTTKEDIEKIKKRVDKQMKQQKIKEQEQEQEIRKDFNKQKKKDPSLDEFKYVLNLNKIIYKKFISHLKNRKRLKEDFNKFIDKYENMQNITKDEIREHNNLFNRIKKAIDNQTTKIPYMLFDDLLYKMLLNMVNLAMKKQNRPTKTIEDFIQPSILKKRKETKNNTKPSDGKNNEYNILQEDYVNLKQYLKKNK